MSRSPKTQQRPWRRFFALVIPTLAYWQLRRAWFLLLFITLGLVAAVVVTTSIPLFADVTMTAQRKGALESPLLAAQAAKCRIQAPVYSRWLLASAFAEGHAAPWHFTRGSQSQEVVSCA